MLQLIRKRLRAIFLLSLLAAWGVAYFSGNAVFAMPLFARRLGVPCSTCHTSPPRLNETGYQFRAAGYRWLSNIGKNGEKKPFNFFDYNGVRLQGRLDAVHTKTGSAETQTNTFNLFALELYPFTGSWGKYLSSNLKTTIFRKKPSDTEGHLRFDGNVKLTLGSKKRFYEIRAGLPFAMEGFGASDAAITNTRPYLQDNAANFNQTTIFTPSKVHQAGGTLGFYQGRTAIQALIRSGMRFTDFQKINDPFMNSLSPFIDRGADFQLNVNRILHHNGGGVSLYYFHGSMALPILSPTGAIQTGRFFQNDFERIAFYASYPVAKRLTLLGGVQRGRDDIVTGDRFTSLGAYTEAAVPLINDLTQAGVRFDWFDQARNKNRNEIYGVTSYMNLWVRDQFRFVAEYQLKERRQAPLPNRKDNAFQLRLIFIK